MRKGSITIYISLIFVSLLLIVSVVAESARINAVYTQTKAVTYMAADSVLSRYGQQIMDDYGILLVYNTNSIEDQLKRYIQANINMADLSVKSRNLMATDIHEIKVNKVGYVVEDGGKNFMEQVNSLLKYTLATEAVDLLISRKEKIENKEEANMQSVEANEDSDSTLEDDVESINGQIEKLKETDLKKQLKTANKREKFLDQLNEIIEEIENYQTDKKEFLARNKTKGGNDYIENNKKIIMQIKDAIEKEQLKADNNQKVDYEKLGEELKDTLEALETRKPNKEDEKNKGIYESAKELLEKGVLALVLEDSSNVSSTAIDTKGLPSQKVVKNHSIDNIKNRASLVVYGNDRFGNYLDVNDKSCLSYEMEYLLNGEDNDRSNLTKTVEKLVAIRNVITLSYIVTDATKMEELSAIAASATVAIGLPFLEPVVKAVLTEAWSLAEAISDVRALMSGKKIQILKNSENWKTSIKNLLGEVADESDSKTAIGYSEYLDLLLLTNKTSTTIYKMYDLIQINIRKNYLSSFRMSKCFSSIKFSVKYETSPLFTAMPWVVKSIGGGNSGYSFTISCDKAY